MTGEDKGRHREAEDKEKGGNGCTTKPRSGGSGRQWDYSGGRGDGNRRGDDYDRCDNKSQKEDKEDERSHDLHAAGKAGIRNVTGTAGAGVTWGNGGRDGHRDRE